MAVPISFGGSLWTERNEDRAFPDWHLGRPWYYFWSVMVDDAEWGNNMAVASHKLSDYLVADYRRQPHITLLPAGFPASNKLQLDAVVDIARLSSTFEVSLGPLSSFSSSPCFALQDDNDQLRNLRSQLRAVMVDENSVVSDTDYQPHLTIGLYRDRFPVAAVCDRIATVETEAIKPIRVTEFVLARYHTDSIKGPIQTVARFELESGRFASVRKSEIIE